MANLIDITSSILSQNTICFETRNINIEHIHVPIEDAKFGILNFKAVTTRETSDELDFLFTIDCSGSMSDLCSDNRTKMQHIIHTLKNMIIFFHEHPTIKINITINAFDSLIYKIVTRTTITDTNFNEIISKIDKISPRGSTNIEDALKESSNEISRLQELFPSNIITHIFMTDGEATDGSREISHLQTIINPDIVNAFIGFGIDHDAAILNGISSVGKSSYYFIDKLESAGLVYGEILHGIVYKLLTDSEILIENGLVYNYKTNTWQQTLKIGDIVSEANKIFNIISSNPEQCRVNIKGNMDTLVILFPSTLMPSADLSVQIFRQRTLQLLYEVNDFCKRKMEFDDEFMSNVFCLRNLSNNNQQYNQIKQEQILIKNKLVSLMEELKNYMTENNLNDNKILKNLCDDIFICYRTFGTKFGTMFCNARQTSQGTQRIYTASNTMDVTHDFPNRNFRRQIPRTPRMPVPPSLIRHHNAYQENYFEAEQFDDESNNINLPILNHTLSDFADTPYLTPQATQVMREISRNDNEIKDCNDMSSIMTQEIY